MSDPVDKTWIPGGCHCRAVRFEVLVPNDLKIFDCNCSICVMKKNTHFIVPQSEFRLLQGADSLTEYRFNTKQARHLFCKVCGVQSFYVPRSNPDGYGVTYTCLDHQPPKVTVCTYDGQNWEQAYEASNIAVLSKPN